MILIALGSNLPGSFGTPEDTIEAAKTALQVRGINILKSSSIWLTEPVPVSDQPWFRNAVIAVDTSFTLEALFKILKRIERDFGRTNAERNAPRLLDLDIIAYSKTIHIAPALNVPHPRMHQRAFVLYPLREIAPEWVHPVLKKTAAELLHNIPPGQVVRQLETRAA